MNILLIDDAKKGALNCLNYQLEKHRRLMALAGSIDEVSADEMLNVIKQSRWSRNSRKNQDMLK